MNYILDQLEELMVSVQQHEIAFIVFSVIALLYLGTILYLICSLAETRHDLRTGVNNFRLTCKVGVEAGVLPESVVKEALEGVEE